MGKQKATFARKPRSDKGSKRKPYTKRKPAKGKAQVKTQTQKGYLPFGVRYNTRLPYVENFSIDAVGTGGASSIGNTFRANSMFDPRFQLGGHQPLQYDGMTAAYERVWVWGAKVVLTFSNPLHDGMWCGYRVRNSTNPVTTAGKNIEYIQEMRDSHVRPINNSGKQTQTFTFYVNNAKTLGISKAQYSDLDYSHPTATGNPLVDVLIEPFAVHTVFEEESNIRVNIKITYFGQFTNPISATQS